MLGTPPLLAAARAGLPRVTPRSLRAYFLCSNRDLEQMLAVLDLGGGSGGGGGYAGPPTRRSAELTQLLAAATTAQDNDGNSSLIDRCEHGDLFTHASPTPCAARSGCCCRGGLVM